MTDTDERTKYPDHDWQAWDAAWSHVQHTLDTYGRAAADGTEVDCRTPSAVATCRSASA